MPKYQALSVDISRLIATSFKFFAVGDIISLKESTVHRPYLAAVLHSGLNQVNARFARK